MRLRRIGGWKGSRRLFLIRVLVVLFCLVTPPVVVLLWIRQLQLPSLLLLPSIQLEKPPSASNPHPSSSLVQKGSQHVVELYSYYDSPQQYSTQQYSNESILASRNQKSWASWEGAPADAVNFKKLADTQLVSQQKIVPIDVAHGQGLLHRGLWLAVLRRAPHGSNKNKYQVFLLRRASTLKTCPGAWSIVGEHSDPAEEWEDTARRALREELQLESLENKQLKLINLLPGHSVLVRTHYREVQRFEFQATALFAVALTAEQVLRIQPDEEVASVQWVAISELLSGQRAYCNTEISSLAALVGGLLIDLGYS